MIAAPCVLLGCAARGWEGARERPEGVEFRVRRPDARSVAIAGDFNGWSATSHALANSRGVWRRVVRLPPGEYAFMYVVDGHEWVSPPGAQELAPDGFGGWNGKLVVR